MNKLQIFTNEKFGKLRSMEINGEPYFVGKDVAEALGYANPKNAIAAHVDEEDKTTALIQGTGSNYKSKAVIINESGIYALIFGSKLKTAVVIDALNTLSESYKNGKVVKAFSWRDKAEKILDSGREKANIKFAFIKSDVTRSIGMR